MSSLTAGERQSRGRNVSNRDQDKKKGRVSEEPPMRYLDFVFFNKVASGYEIPFPLCNSGTLGVAEMRRAGE